MAVTQQRRADAAAAAADARRLAAQALVERDLGRALLFGVAATRLYDTPETRANLLATLNRAPALLRTDTLTDGDQYQGLALSPDGLTLALGSARGRIQLYDAESLRFKRTLTYPAPHVARELDFTRDGRRLVTFADLVPAGDHGVVEWDLATGDPVSEPFGPMSPRPATCCPTATPSCARRRHGDGGGLEPQPSRARPGPARAGTVTSHVDRQRPALDRARPQGRHDDRRGRTGRHTRTQRSPAAARSAPTADAAYARGSRRRAVGRRQPRPAAGWPASTPPGSSTSSGPATAGPS